jgi:uncharacterized coiled-coil protein SlyX
MSKKGANDNGFEIRRLRRTFKRLYQKLEAVQTTTEIIELSRALAYVAGQKAALVKLEWDRAIEQRIEELERIAGIARQGKISK